MKFKIDLNFFVRSFSFYSNKTHHSGVSISGAYFLMGNWCFDEIVLKYAISYIHSCLLLLFFFCRFENGWIPSLSCVMSYSVLLEQCFSSIFISPPCHIVEWGDTLMLYFLTCWLSPSVSPSWWMNVTKWLRSYIHPVTHTCMDKCWFNYTFVRYTTNDCC